MKAVVLAGGTGSRLWPLTIGVSKQLLAVYDKPLIYYPLTTIFEAQIREILFITRPSDQELFQTLLGDGSQFGAEFSYAVQPSPDGLAQSFIIGESFIGSDSCALILGDNIFDGANLRTEFENLNSIQGGLVFAYKVSDPSSYGVVEFNEAGIASSIEEKPEVPKSKFAVPGLYFYDNSVIEVAKSVRPSHRGELEITAVNSYYLKKGLLRVHVLPDGTAWLDSGTFSSLHDAGNYVRIIEERQGRKVGCPEEVAWRNGWISDSQMLRLAHHFRASGYGGYLTRLLTDDTHSGE